MLVLSESKDLVEDYLVYSVVILSLLISLSSSPCLATTPAASLVSLSNQANHYLVYRVHQIDINNRNLGSRSSTINLEGITPLHLSDSSVRKCALFKLADILNENNQFFLDKILSQTLVSGVLIIFKNISVDLTREELINLHKIEERLLSTDINVPIYLINENDHIDHLYREYNQQTKNPKTLSLYELFEKNIFIDSHQFVVTGPNTKSIEDAVVTCFEAKLIGTGIESKLPNYAIVAHYDSYSIVPNLSFGADSNGSGLVILLELLRVFSKLYSNNKTRPKANLHFYVSGGGKENYFGTQKWIDYYNGQQNKASDDVSLFKKMGFILCLDSLADSRGSNQFYMHVARPPRPDSPAAKFYETLLSVLASESASMNLTQVPARINLAQFAWEHEPFSVRKLSAFTLSQLDSPNAPVRRSLADVYDSRYVATLEHNTRIISETFVRLFFPEVKNILANPEFSVSRSLLDSLFKYFTNSSRHQQLLLTKAKRSAPMPIMLTTMETILRKHADSLVIHNFRVSKANPEFIFYDPVASEMSIYNIKPAAFDLLVTLVILTYLAVFYLLAKNYQLLSTVARSINMDKFVSQMDNFKTKTK